MIRIKRELSIPNFKSMTDKKRVRLRLFIALASILMQGTMALTQCTADAGADFDVCLNSPVVSLASGGVWSGSPLVTANGAFTPTAPGTYNLTFTIDTGMCTDSDDLVIIVHPLPTTTAVDDITICPGQTAQLGATAISPNGAIILYSWSGGAVSNGLSQNPTATPGATTFYNVTVVDAENCSDPDQVTVFVLPVSAVNAGNNISLCTTSGPTQLTGFSPAGGTWSGAGVNGTGLFTPGAIGNYILTYSYTNAQGCTSSDQMTASVVAPSAIDAGPDFEVCANSTAFSLVPLNPGGSWSGPSVTPGGLFNPASAGSFNLTYTFNMGACSATDQVLVLVNELPVANAGSDLAFCVGDSEILNGSASGGETPYSALWNNGGSLLNAAQFNPTAFPIATTSFVLTVTDNNNCFDTDAMTLTVSVLPDVNAWNDISVCNQTIATQLIAATPVGGIWSGTGITPGGSFTPSGLGNYTVVYSYTDSNGCSASDDLVVTAVAPIAISAGSDVQVCANDGIQLLSLNTASTGTWLGTGIANSLTGSFNPQIAGSGNFIITIENGTGSCYVSDQMEVEVMPLPAVTAGIDELVCGNESVLNLSGASPIGGSWQGTGIVDPLAGTFDPSVGVGVYNLFYFYTDAITTCTDTAYMDMTVVAIPNAQFTVPAIGCSGEILDLENISIGANSFLWEFENGSDDFSFEPNYSFNTDGTYWIKLTATNAAGCSDQTLSLVEIISIPEAAISLSINEGCAPLEVDFSNNSIGVYTTYSWNYDGQTLAVDEPSTHIFSEGAGIMYYDINLTAENICGSDVASDEVIVNPLPYANFSTNILSSVCSPVTVEFSNISTGGSTSWDWNFGDGTMSTDADPEINVYTTGSSPTDFPIWLHVENGCGEDSIQVVVTVQPNMVSSQFSASATSGCDPLLVNFTDSGNGATQVTYDFGGLASSNDFNAQYIFSEPGNFIINQYATDGCGFDTTSTIVSVLLSPDAVISSDVSSICAGNEIHFEAVTSNAAVIEWDMGDGNISSNPLVDHQFDQAGNYIVYFTATATTLCEFSDSIPITVNANPVAAFTVPASNSCSPLITCLENISTGATNFEWQLDDGTTSSEISPCFSFENSGTIPITQSIVLIAETSQACTDTTQLSLVINPIPAAGFVLDEIFSCEVPAEAMIIEAPVALSNYEWNVNGNLVSNDDLPSFNFNNVGVYEIALNATNEFGCTNSSLQIFTVHPAVEASFSGLPLSGCEDLHVQFASTSTNASQYFWTFGNDDTSAQANPAYVFEEEGFYDVSLIVISPEGCENEVEIENYVEVFSEPEAEFNATTYETTIFFPEITFENESEDVIALEWNFGDGSTSSASEVTHSYINTGVYPVTLTVWNEEGCENSQTKQIEITSDFSVFIPNSFSPNHDGLNDVFIPAIAGTDHIHTYELIVFNRWGEQVFATNDPREPWIGNMKEGEFYGETSTYTYRLIVQLSFSTEKKDIMGHVTLIR